MIIIGLILLIVAAIFGLDLLWKNTFAVQNPVVFGQTLGIHDARWFFLVGVITGAVVLLGIAMILAGIGRKGRKAVEHRREKKEAGKADESRERLEAENASLRHDLDTRHGAAAPQAAPAAEPTGESRSGPGATRADQPR